MPRPHGKQCDSWWSATVPAVEIANGSNLWVGNRFKFTAGGRLMGVRFYSSVEAASHWCWLSVESTSNLLRGVEFFDQSTLVAGWRQTWFRKAFRVNTTDTYRLAVAFGGTHYWHTAHTGAVTHGVIQLLNGFTSTVWDISNAALTVLNFQQAVDVLFLAD
jgi:Domain of unknown function (DUF4082)